MKNLSKKISNLIVIFMLIIGLIGCNNNSNNPTDNKDKDTFIYLSSWTREGVGTHMNSGANVGPMYFFALEGLARYVRVSNEVVYQLAERFEHLEENELGEIISKVYLKQDAKWHNGDDFIADDIRGYYILNHATLTEYIYDIKVIDEKTLAFYWRPELEPNSMIKDLLLSQDRSGSVSYKIFKKQVDRCWEILQNCPSVDSDKLAPFGKRISGENMSAYTSNYQDYRNVKTDWFVATGPYKLSKISSTQMLLEKHSEYYDSDNIKFQYIKAINGVNDLNTIYAQLEAGNIDYQDGTPAKDVLERIIKRNEKMAHYKIYDPGSIGMLFNLDSKIWIFYRFYQLIIRIYFNHTFTIPGTN
jgi:peptide/nickel transport system substrate-binding protein